MKIVHLIGGFALDWGGPSRVVREMAAQLAARGHAVRVVSTDAAPGGRRLRLGDPGQPAPPPGTVEVRLHRADLARPPYPSMAMLADVWRTARAFDVAHVHGVFNAPVTSAMLALRARGVPYVVRTCGMLDPWSFAERGRAKAIYWRAIERANLDRAAAIQVSTTHEEAAVRALGVRVEVVRLPQGVGQDNATIGGSPWPRPYVLFLGRVARKKGLPLLVEAVAGLDVDLVIVGPDELGHAGELARGPRVHVVGPVRDAGLKAAWYAHARAFALPSLDENFGVAVIEAAQHGTPVVVTDRVGLAPDVIADGAGVVVPREVAAFRSALSEVLAAGRAAYAEGTSRLAARFAWEPLAARLEALYVRIVTARR